MTQVLRLWETRPQRARLSVGSPPATATRWRRCTPGGGSPSGLAGGGGAAGAAAAGIATVGRACRAWKRTRVRGNRVGPVAMPAWVQANCASSAAAPTATAAWYSRSAAAAAATSGAGGWQAAKASPANLSASALPTQSTSERRGGSGSGRCAGTHLAVTSLPAPRRSRAAQRSPCSASGGPGRSHNAATPWETCRESVTMTSGPLRRAAACAAA